MLVTGKIKKKYLEKLKNVNDEITYMIGLRKTEKQK